MQILPIPSKRRSLKSLLAALVAGAGLSLAPVTATAATWAPAPAVVAPAPAPAAAPPPGDIGAPPSDPDQNDAPVTATSRQPGESKTETICNDGVDRSSVTECPALSDPN